MALRLSRLFGKGGDEVVMKDGANSVTLENDAVMKVDALSATDAGRDDPTGGGNPATFELTPAGSHAQALDATGDEVQSLAGDRFVAVREAGSGRETGIHDIHMNQGNTPSLQQQMQSESQRARGPAGEHGDSGATELKSETEVVDYREGGTNAKWELSEFDASKNEGSDPADSGTLADYNPKVAGEADGLYEWIKSSALPEVDDEVLVEFQAREPGRIEFPNLARGSHSDTMPVEEVHFLQGTGKPGQLDDDGPSNLLGDFNSDGKVDTTDAMSLNFEEVKLAAIQDGVLSETESDVLAADFDGIEIPD